MGTVAATALPKTTENDRHTIKAKCSVCETLKPVPQADHVFDLIEDNLFICNECRDEQIIVDAAAERRRKKKNKNAGALGLFLGTLVGATVPIYYAVGKFHLDKASHIHDAFVHISSNGHATITTGGALMIAGGALLLVLGLGFCVGSCTKRQTWFGIPKLGCF